VPLSNPQGTPSIIVPNQKTEWTASGNHHHATGFLYYSHKQIKYIDEHRMAGYDHMSSVSSMLEYRRGLSKDGPGGKE
jgi:hypothetical protein